jgi:outer membrane protein OmpA-like peptidoglycan-associated protein
LKEIIMKKSLVAPSFLVIAALLGACSSAPTTTSLLEQTRSDYRMAQSNPKVASYAPMEMTQAGEALAQANRAAEKKDSAKEVDRLAYLAKQQIAITQEVAKRKSAEADVADAGKERDQIRLDQRTNEANQAKRMAQIAQGDAELAKRDAQIAQGDAAQAQREALEAQMHNADLEAQLAGLVAIKTERGIVITFGDVLFGTDQARLTPEGIRTAQKLADVLQQNPQRAVLIEGFTDSTGSAAHNQELSERRAGAVQRALQDMGVGRDRVSMRGYGVAYPVAANDTSSNRRLNRRVEIVLSNDDGKIMQR